MSINAFIAKIMVCAICAMAFASCTMPIHLKPNPVDTFVHQTASLTTELNTVSQKSENLSSQSGIVLLQVTWPRFAVQAIPQNTQNILVLIVGAGIEPAIVTVIPKPPFISGIDFASSIKLRVPAGKNRTISAFAKDSNNQVLAKGSAVKDLPAGVPVNVDIRLSSDLSTPVISPGLKLQLTKPTGHISTTIGSTVTLQAERINTSIWLPKETISKVEFYIDDFRLVGTATKPPYTALYDTSQDTLGKHWLKAVAKDAKGAKLAESNVFSITLYTNASSSNGSASGAESIPTPDPTPTPVPSSTLTPGVWTQLAGPSGTQPYTIALDPNNLNTLYASTYGHGIYKSTDGGASWVEKGLPNLFLYSIAVDPNNANTVYAGSGNGGLYKSTDGGTSWNAINTGIAGVQNIGIFQYWTFISHLIDSFAIQGIAIAPTNSNTVYIKGSAGPSGQRLFKSTDGGNNWVLQTPYPPPKYQSDLSTLVVDPSDSNTLYRVGDVVQAGLAKSTDSGTTWNSVNTGLTNLNIACLAVDPVTPTTLYAGSQTGGFFKSTNGGTNWSVPSAGMAAQPLTFLAVAPSAPTTLYAGQGNTVFKSVDGGSNWGAGIPFSASPLQSGRDILVHPANANVVYVVTVDGNVFKSTDGASTWNQISLNNATKGRPFNRIQVDPANPNNLYAKVLSAPYQSMDGGTSWSKIATLPDGVNGFIFDGNILHAGIQGVNQLYRSVDGGVNWALPPGGSWTGDILSLDLEPSVPSTLYSGTVYMNGLPPPNGGLFKSTDAGGSWNPLGNGIFVAKIIMKTIVDPNDSNTVYVALSGPPEALSPTTEGISKSTDGGANWNASNTGLTNFNVGHLVMDANTGSLYAGTTNGLFKSTDNAANWVPINNGLPSLSITGLVIHPNDNNKLYVSTASAGVFVSTDAGANWASLNTGLTSNVLTLAIANSNPVKLYAGTFLGPFVMVP